MFYNAVKRVIAQYTIPTYRNVYVLSVFLLELRNLQYIILFLPQKVTNELTFRLNMHT